MFDVHDWTELRRLYHRERLSKTAIARRLGMSRPTVIKLLELPDPPHYEREPAGSKLDPHKDEIASMLDRDPEVPATVMFQSNSGLVGMTVRRPGFLEQGRTMVRSRGGEVRLRAGAKFGCELSIAAGTLDQATTILDIAMDSITEG